MEIIFIIIVTILLFVFGIIWSKKTFLDTFVKLIFISLSIYGLFLILHYFNFIIVV